MTKFDIRLRRNQFTKHRIERHKNFQNLMGNYDKSSRKKTRGIMVLVILVILTIAILLAFFNRVEEPKKEQQDDKIGLHMEIDKTEPIDKTTTVYKL